MIGTAYATLFLIGNNNNPFFKAAAIAVTSYDNFLKLSDTIYKDYQLTMYGENECVEDVISLISIDNELKDIFSSREKYLLLAQLFKTAELRNNKINIMETVGKSIANLITKGELPHPDSEEYSEHHVIKGLIDFCNQFHPLAKSSMSKVIDYNLKNTNPIIKVAKYSKLEDDEQEKGAII